MRLHRPAGTRRERDPDRRATGRAGRHGQTLRCARAFLALADARTQIPPTRGASDRQALASLCAPSLERQAPRPRLHAGAKAVRTRAPAPLWLVSTFHLKSCPEKERNVGVYARSEARPASVLGRPQDPRRPPAELFSALCANTPSKPRSGPGAVGIFADPRVISPGPSPIVLERSREELLAAARSTRRRVRMAHDRSGTPAAGRHLGV